MNNILITGATGFIGRYLVEQFYENNNVVCLVRPGTKNLKRIAQFSDKIKIVEHNIRDPYDLSAFKDIDIILHAGANPSAADSISAPVESVLDNVIGTLNLLELARQINLKKFVYYSSGEVFGPIPIGNDSGADDAYRSNSPYAASKASGEELCVSYSHTYQLPMSIIHINNTFGPMCQPNRLPTIIIKKLLNNETLDIHVGKENQIGGRRWFYAGDVASHTDFVINEQQDLCEKWNSAGNKFINNFEFANNIADIMGKKLNYNFIPVDRPGHDLCYSVDPQKFYAKGWTEPVSYQQRLEQTVNWYLNNQEWLYV